MAAEPAQALKPLTLPSDADITGRDLGAEELALLSKVIDSGTLNCTNGTQVKALEQAFAERLGVPHARAVTSGTAACHTAIAVIEDAAQAFLATQDGRLIGTIGAIGAFSLQQGKHMTSGEGGLVVTSDPGHARWMRLFSDKTWGTPMQTQPYGRMAPAADSC